jgi:hypothetical protein
MESSGGLHLNERNQHYTFFCLCDFFAGAAAAALYGVGDAESLSLTSSMARFYEKKSAKHGR